MTITDCDQIMVDIDSNDTGTDSLSTITTPTLSYCPLSEDSCSDRNSTPGFPTIEIRSPDLLTKNLLTTPRNRLSYQGDIRNKMLSNDRRSFQEIKFNNLQSSQNESNNKTKSDVSILTDSLSYSSKEETFCDVVMGNNYERLGPKNSIFHQEDSSCEEIMPPCKNAICSNENLNFESKKSVENIHYKPLVVSSPESNDSSQCEMSVSPKVLEC